MSTTSTAIYSNPLFATYSVYARNASITGADNYTTPGHGGGNCPGGGNVLVKLAGGNVRGGKCPGGEVSVSPTFSTS